MRNAPGNDHCRNGGTEDGVSGENGALTSDDPRYEEIFNVERESTAGGHALIADPYPLFAALREKGGVYPGDLEEALTGISNPFFDKQRPHYTTLTFDAGSKALQDNMTYSSLHYQEMPSVMTSIGHTVLTMIGNEHARYRSSIQPMLTRQQAMGWWREKWIEPFVDTLLDQIAGAGSADLSLQLCARLPMHTVTAAYGLSSDEALEFRDALVGSMAVEGTDHAANHAKVRSVLLAAIGERRRERQDDLISRLIDAPFTDAEGKVSRLSDDDIISFSRLLLLAGGGTTYRQLGITIFALLSNPEQLEALRADRTLMEPAIQEGVRWNCTDPMFHRLTTKASVLGGVEIPEGAIIDVCLGAGNRDPQRWEDPDRYDLHRPMKRHIGFAAGPHTCLGRFVAEAEMDAAINALLDRFPKLRFDDRVERPKIIGGLHARGVNHLKVRFD
ncbi:cytochrome P450 [Sphingomonas solaris]|uniref:Cytochrome P450 n=1 Tax=Alterirhizorhabdus solaris TaxID=2529389 RepID=A0A558RBK5_9SPHN|nr:cytochrome P450 [Sphingomonas solaris]TVV76756.1 cytochrome P450 [Sphingomonas solaris]